jgi:hypothetical protein
LIKPSGEVVQHFGVKGMHWGVRKKEPPAPLSTERRTIKKGQQLQTVTAEGGANLNRRVFTSHTKMDNLAYRSTYANSLKYVTNNADTFVNTVVPSRDLKVASEKDAFDEFKRLYEADKPGMINALAESFEASTRLMIGLSDVKDEKMVDIKRKDFSKKGEAWIDKQGYDLFLTGAGTAREKNELYDSYYSNLAKRGFDAIVDEVDVKGGLADDPIVILKPKGSVKVTNTIPLTEADIKLAGQNYKQENKRLKAERKAEKKLAKSGGG